MAALDAFHVKQQIWEHSIHAPVWHDFANSFTASVRGEYANEGPESPVGDPNYTETGPEFDRRVRATFEMSETFYVSPLMNRMVTAASEQWPEDEPVTAEDFPTPYGFIYVPGGLTVIDVRGRMQTTEVITWRVLGSKVDFTYWCHKRHDPPAQRARWEWQQMPDWLPWHLTSVTLGGPLPKMLQFGTVLPPEVSDQIKWGQTEQGMIATLPEGWTADQMRPGFKTDNHMSWVVAALRIMQQPLAAVDRIGLPANVRRDLMKHRKRLKMTKVTVIDFRRREGDFQHSGEREYTHRFLRRGHWRRQPYKRDDGTWDRRRIWIHPTVVGDPKLPLILRDHVNALTR